jgi:hypothetical protein
MSLLRFLHRGYRKCTCYSVIFDQSLVKPRGFDRLGLNKTPPRPLPRGSDSRLILAQALARTSKSRNSPTLGICCGAVVCAGPNSASRSAWVERKKG